MQALLNTASYLLAFAVWRLFPSAKLDGGSVHDYGFSYDFYIDQPLNDEIIAFIEAEMNRLSLETPPFEVKEMMRENAAALFDHLKQPYLAELALQSDSNIVTVLQEGERSILCPGSECEIETGYYKILKYHKIDGTTRIQGIAAKFQKDFKRLLKQVELAESRDHRLLGKELDFYVHMDGFPSGSIFWLPKGAFVKQNLEKWFYEEHVENGFLPIQSPKLVSGKGHADALIVRDDKEYPIPDSLKALHAQAYNLKTHSYKDLPIRYAELHETYPISKETGLLGAAPQTQESTHIFCTEEQVKDELISSLQFIIKTINMFGFEYQALFHQPLKKSFGREEAWLREALTALAVRCDEQRVTDGPSIVMKQIDSIGRQVGVCELKIDLQTAAKYKLKYLGPDDKMHEPVILSRTIFSSLERLIAFLIENFEGALPLWLAYEQVRVVGVKPEHTTYATSVQQKFNAAGIRAKLDDQNETLAAKIHTAEKEKVPYVVVVGDQEEKNGTIAIRKNAEAQKGVNLEAFIAQLQQEVRDKHVNLREHRKKV